MSEYGTIILLNQEAPSSSTSPEHDPEEVNSCRSGKEYEAQRIASSLSAAVLFILHYTCLEFVGS